MENTKDSQRKTTKTSLKTRVLHCNLEGASHKAPPMGGLLARDPTKQHFPVIRPAPEEPGQGECFGL